LPSGLKQGSTYIYGERTTSKKHGERNDSISLTEQSITLTQQAND